MVGRDGHLTLQMQWRVVVGCKGSKLKLTEPKIQSRASTIVNDALMNSQWSTLDKVTDFCQHGSSDRSRGFLRRCRGYFGWRQPGVGLCSAVRTNTIL
jgi:hypothetical protein